MTDDSIQIQTPPDTTPSGTASDPISPPEISPTPPTDSITLPPETAQMGGSEPLGEQKQTESEITAVESSSSSEVKSELKQPTEPIPAAEVKLPQAQSVSPCDFARSLLVKAQFAIQIRKRKKLDRIMALFAKRTSITNDEVEKLLHVSDATATRYLSILEKENKIKQSAKTGKGVSYSKI